MDKKTAIVETVTLLLETLQPGAVAEWFQEESDFLGRPPIDLLTENRYEEVLAAARAFNAKAHG